MEGFGPGIPRQQANLALCQFQQAISLKDEMSGYVYPFLLFGKMIRGGFLYLRSSNLSMMGGLMMAKTFRSDDHRKDYFIHELLLLGIYKKGEQHLFELTVEELEEEYTRLTNT